MAGVTGSGARSGSPKSAARLPESEQKHVSQEDLRELRMKKLLEYVGKIRDLEATIPSVEADLTIKMRAMPVDVRDYFTSYSRCRQEISDKSSELAHAQADLQRVTEQHRDGTDYRFCMQYMGLDTNSDDSELVLANKLVTDIKSDLAALKRRRGGLRPMIDCAEVWVYTELQNRLNLLKMDLETKKRRVNIMIKLVYQ